MTHMPTINRTSSQTALVDGYSSPQAAVAGTHGHVVVISFNPRLNIVSVARNSILGQKLHPKNIYMINILVTACTV